MPWRNMKKPWAFFAHAATGPVKRRFKSAGRVYFYTGDKQKSLDYSLQALQIIREIGPRKEEAALLSTLFGIYRSLGQNSVALDFINQSLLLYKALGDDPGVGDTLFSIGIYYFDIGERQKVPGCLDGRLIHFQEAYR